MQITKRDPSDLTVHPALRLVPDAWGKEDPAFIALVEDVRARGFDQALQVDEEDRVIDGRGRLKAAKQLQIEEVPVRVRKQEEVFGIIVGSLVQRRHYTKGQLAYVTYPLMQHAFEESSRRRLENLKQHARTQAGLSPLAPKTVDEMAEQIGIGRATFFQAKAVHEAFARDTGKYEFEVDGETRLLTLKEYFEGRILDREEPAGLGAVLAGIAGMKATKGKAKPQPKQMELFEAAFDAVKIRWERIRERPEAESVLVSQVEGWPVDLCEKMGAAIKRRLTTETRRARS